MKRLLQTLVWAAIIFTFVACEKDKSLEPGAGDLIELDKAILSFAEEGGEDTVSMLNYRGWDIEGGYEDIFLINGYWQYSNYVYPTSLVSIRDFLDGDWYRAVIPENAQHTIIITVTPNTTGAHRKARIIMRSGNDTGLITIYQE